MSSEGTKGGRSLLQIEEHSIDFIPESERHGKPWQQLPFWFGNGLQPHLGGHRLHRSVAGARPGLVGGRHRRRHGLRHGVHGAARQPGTEARPAADDPVARAVRLARRGPPLVLAVFIYISFIVATALFTRSAFNHLFNINAGIWFYPIFIAMVDGHRHLRLRLGAPVQPVAGYSGWPSSSS